MDKKSPLTNLFSILKASNGPRWEKVVPCGIVIGWHFGPLEHIFWKIELLEVRDLKGRLGTKPPISPLTLGKITTTAVLQVEARSRSRQT